MAQTLTQEQMDQLLKAINHHDPNKEEDEEDSTERNPTFSSRIHNFETQKIIDKYEERIDILEKKYKEFYKRLQKIVYN